MVEDFNNFFCILCIQADGYSIDSTKFLEQNGFAFHDGQTVPPGLVKKTLVKDVGLSEEEIRSILGQK